MEADIGLSRMAWGKLKKARENNFGKKHSGMAEFCRRRYKYGRALFSGQKVLMVDGDVSAGN